MFRLGNNKLGKSILTWSIPAIKTCPGSTEACRSVCYADTGFFVSRSVSSSHQRNLELSKQDDFVKNAIKDLKSKKSKVVRVHVAGDLYDAEYALKWFEIMKACPDKRFFIYTRCWRVPEIEPILRGIAKLSNVRLWYSLDKDTGKPKHIPSGVRLAYMMLSDTDKPRYECTLFFRDNRRGVLKKVGSGMVCPVENGATPDMNCEKCKFCFK